MNFRRSIRAGNRNGGGGFLAGPLVAVAAGALFVGSGFRYQDDRASAAAQNYIVHEWGTFTTVSGSGGELLPGLQVEEELLPDFVHSHAGMGVIGGAAKGWVRQLANVTVKMETPVLYFYSDVARHVRVDVGFRGGSISQWYPNRSGGEEPAAPEMHNGVFGGGEIDFAAGYDGSISWDIDVLAPGPRPEWEIFRGTETMSWIAPRRPDSNVVETASGQREKFLFYRGVGNFEPPLRFSMSGETDLVIENRGAGTVPFLMVFDNRGPDFSSPSPDATLPGAAWPPVKAGIITVESLEGGSTHHASLDLIEPADDWRAAVYERMWYALVDAGLSGSEADAMLQTWWKSYFESPGLRVFWIVPSDFVDAVLPIRLDPPPTQLARVIVGRSEVLTPAFERALRAELAADPDARSWDRFGAAYEARVQQVLDAEAATD